MSEVASELPRLTLWDRSGTLEVDAAPEGVITGPVSEWTTDHIVIDVAGADQKARIDLGRIVDEELFVEATDDATRKLVLARPEVGDNEAVRAAGPDRAVFTIGPHGWRDIRTGATYGLSSNWTDATNAARRAAAALGIGIDNLYPLEEDVHAAVERAELAGAAATARSARMVVFQFKRDASAPSAARTIAGDLGREAREAEWNSPQKVAQREAIARARALEASEAAARRVEEDQKRAETEAREQRRRAKAAETRKRNKQARRELEAAGWPNGWGPSAVTRWEVSGGTATLAQAWSARGFSHLELTEAAAITGVPALPVLDGTADFYKTLGDSLTDLAAKRWPIPPGDTTISIKSISHDGTARRTCVVASENETVVWEWHRTSDGTPWRAPAIRRFASLAAVAAAADTPLHVDTQNLSQVIGLTYDSLNLLAVRGNGAWEPTDHWDDTIGCAWVDDLEYPADQAEGLGATILPVSLGNDTALGALEAGGRIHYIAVTDEETQGERLAESWWYSEPGGAPISWDGRDYVTQIAHDLVLFHATGDVERDPQLHPLPPTDEGLARLLAVWIEQIEATVSAALTLESLDPEERLSAEAREAWADRLNGYTAGVNLYVEPAVVDMVRAELRRDPTNEYTAIVAALAAPDECGHELAEALDANTGSSFAHL